MKEYATVILRTFTGLYFFLVGLKLFLNQEMQGALAATLPLPLAPVFVIIFYWLMIFSGLLLMLGGLTRYAATLTALLVVSSLIYTSWLTSAIFTGAAALSVIKNIVIFGATLSLMMTGSDKWSLDSWQST